MWFCFGCPDPLKKRVRLLSWSHRRTDRWIVTGWPCGHAAVAVRARRRGSGSPCMDVQSCDAFSHAGTTSLCTQNITADQNHMGFSSSSPEQTGFVLLLETPILMVSNLQLHPPRSCFEWTKRWTASQPNNTQDALLMSFRANHGTALPPTRSHPR